MQGWIITSRRKQTRRIETRRQKPPLQSLFFFFRSQQKIGSLCAKMKAGTAVLFTLFLPVLAGPPVEAAESIQKSYPEYLSEYLSESAISGFSGYPSYPEYLSEFSISTSSYPNGASDAYPQYLQYLRASNFPGVPYGRIKSYVQYLQYLEDSLAFRGVPYGRIIWYRLNGLYDWYQAQGHSPPRLAISALFASLSASRQDYNMQEIKRRIKNFEGTYEIKLEDLLELGELQEQQHHLKAEEFKNFISTFEEFKNFVSTFEDAYDFEIFLENYTQEAKATVKAMKAIKEKNSPNSNSNSMAPMAMAPMAMAMAMVDSLDSLDSLDSSMAVESTKRQRSIIFGLTTLTIFAGLALLLFWILEEQKKKSRTNIKA